MSRVLDLWAGMTGTVLPFAGSTAPEGWLLCFGQAVSRTTYANLFAVIGTTFGAGDGSTTFNLPDIRGRVAAGKDNMGGAAAGRLSSSGIGSAGLDGTALGAAGGNDRHALTSGQMPQHGHSTYAQSSGGITNTGATTYVTSSGNSNTTLSTVTQTAGNSEAHPNVQPTIILNQIIKT